MPLIWREKRGLPQECVLPPPPKVPRHFHVPGCTTRTWSCRMTAQKDGVYSPFKPIPSVASVKLLQTTSKASTVCKKAVSVSRTLAGKPCPSSSSPEPFNSFRQEICGSGADDSGVVLCKLLDREQKHKLDFATMLKFFELYCWCVDEGSNKHEEWVQDWHDILNFLGGLPEDSKSAA